MLMYGKTNTIKINKFKKVYMSQGLLEGRCLCFRGISLNIPKCFFKEVMIWAPRVAQSLKNTPAMQKTWVWSLGWEDPLEESMATHFSILVWRIPMDRGAWLIAFHGFAKSETRLSNSAQQSTVTRLGWWNKRMRATCMVVRVSA